MLLHVIGMWVHGQIYEGKTYKYNYKYNQGMSNSTASALLVKFFGKKCNKCGGNTNGIPCNHTVSGTPHEYCIHDLNIEHSEEE